ncbi:Hypothetical_protein [Hexamita inflata]|uniref:Hypothetical_protein n=1 Tax=Hexamita inflata TaxID=28002 RepID=A0ABP1J6B4_9EUKA
MTCHLQVQRISDYDSDMKAVRLTTAVQALLWILRDILQQDTILITQKTLWPFSTINLGTTCPKIEQHQRKEGSSTQIQRAFRKMEAYLTICQTGFCFVVTCLQENEQGFSVALLTFGCTVFASYLKIYRHRLNQITGSILRQCIWLNQEVSQRVREGPHKAHYIVNSALLKQSKQNIFITYTTEQAIIILQLVRYTTESALNVVHISVTHL